MSKSVSKVEELDINLLYFLLRLPHIQDGDETLQWPSIVLMKSHQVNIICNLRSFVTVQQFVVEP